MFHLLFYFFFFSSRRRHTRSYGDWSSDVCSSDLIALRSPAPVGVTFERWVTAQDAIDDLQIGRASCRERVWMSAGSVLVERKRWGRRSSGGSPAPASGSRSSSAARLGRTCSTLPV